MKKTIFVDFHGFTGKFTFSSVVLLLLFFMQIVSKTTYMFMFSSKKQNEISLPFPLPLNENDTGRERKRFIKSNLFIRNHYHGLMPGRYTNGE